MSGPRRRMTWVCTWFRAILQEPSLLTGASCKCSRSYSRGAGVCSLEGTGTRARVRQTLTVCHERSLFWSPWRPAMGSLEVVRYVGFLVARLVTLMSSNGTVASGSTWHALHRTDWVLDSRRIEWSIPDGTSGRFELNCLFDLNGIRNAGRIRLAYPEGRGHTLRSRKT